MKTLKDHVILYDAVCPMCTIYTKGFIKAGMLDADGRAPYQAMHGDLKKLVNGKRAVNEIALVNRRTGAVHYGVQSLFRIIENSLPFFKPLFRWPLFALLADGLYKFISFNRRVIVPASDAKPKYEPQFKPAYRLAYLVITWFVTALILNQYGETITAVIPAGNFYREFAICGGQLIWQGLIISALNKKRLWDYLGNMMTISVAGSLLLLLGMGILKSFSVTHSLIYTAYFMAVAGAMFLEHIRRTGLLNVSGWLTASWVLYRLIVLAIIL